MITVFLTEVYERPGGIPRFNGYLLRALARVSRDMHQKIRAFSLNDIAAPKAAAGTVDECLEFRGFARKKIEFVRNVMPAGLASDLLIVGHVALAPLAWLIKLINPKLKYAVIAHGIEVWHLASWAQQWALKQADLILSVSQFTRRRLVGQGLDGGKIEYLPNTVDGQVFRPGIRSESLLRHHGLQPNHQVILTVGRLGRADRAKGYETVLAAFRRTIQTHPRAVLIIVGDGDDRHELEQRARALGLEGLVIFAGHVPDERLIDYYNLADVFVLPSEKEGFGIVFLEALCCGKPVIAGNRDGAVDPLLDGKLGLLIEPGDAGKLDEAIDRVLGRRVAIPYINSDYLRDQVLKHYGYPQFLARLQTILGRMLT